MHNAYSKTKHLYKGVLACVLVSKNQSGVVCILIIFKIDLCSVKLMKCCRPDIVNYMAEQMSILKNNQIMYNLHFTL